MSTDVRLDGGPVSLVRLVVAGHLLRGSGDHPAGQARGPRGFHSRARAAFETNAVLSHHAARPALRRRHPRRREEGREEPAPVGSRAPRGSRLRTLRRSRSPDVSRVAAARGADRQRCGRLARRGELQLPQPVFDPGGLRGPPGRAAGEMDVRPLHRSERAVADHFSDVRPWPDRTSCQATPARDGRLAGADQAITVAEFSDPPRVGEAIVFSGSSQWHYRDPIDPADGRRSARCCSCISSPAGKRTCSIPATGPRW